MPRQPRRCRPFTLQHIISRFVDGEFRFVDDEDRSSYLRLFAERAPLTDWGFLAYALMSSHVHHAAVPGQQDTLCSVFHPPHTRFGLYWHRRHGGFGSVFAGRPTNHELDPGRIGGLVAYIHMNPVRASVVTCPADSSWTSHRVYLRKDPAPRWLDVERNLGLCGFEDTAAGRARFHDFVLSCGMRPPDPVEARLDIAHGAMCPDGILTRQPALPRTPDELPWADLARASAAAFDVRTEDLSNRVRRHPVVAARRAFARVAVYHLRCPAAAVAQQLGITTAATYKLLQGAAGHKGNAALDAAIADIAARLGGQLTEGRGKSGQKLVRVP